MKKLRNNKIRKLLAFMVALALMVSCMPSAYTISASEAFGDGTEDIFTDGEITSEPAAEESTPDVSSADQEETEQAQQSTLTYENDSVKVTAEALEDGALPQNTALKADSVNENSSVSYDTVSQKLSAAATDKGSSLRGFFAYDVYFADGDGNRVEPNGRVRVTFEYKTPAAPELTDAASTSVTVEKLHYNSSTGDTDVNTLQANEDLKVLNVNEGKQIQTLQVETGNAAVFAVMWDSPETADVKAEAVSGNEDEVPIASEELTDGMDISDEPEQDAAETPAAENPEVTPDAEPSEAPAENPDAEPTEAPAEDPDVVEEPAEDIASPEDVPAADENGETSLIEVLGDDTNLRVSPSIEAEVLATVNAGTQLTLLDTVTAEDGATWYKVSWEGTEAYIRSDMAQVVDSSEEAEEPEDVQEEEIQPEITRYDYTSGEVNVKVTLTDPADLPDDAKLFVTPVELSQEAEDQITEEAIKEKKAIEKIHSYDIKFLVDGEEVQPGATVKVSVSLNDEKKIKDADVYHVDENDNVENMDGSVAKNGDVEFETTHFSTYVIVNKKADGSNITVTVEHYKQATGTEEAKKIYADDVRELQVGQQVDCKKALNWDIAEVKVNTGGADTTATPDSSGKIYLAQDATVKVYYTPKTGTTVGTPTFYDYTVKAVSDDQAGKYGYPSINQNSNYPSNASSNRITVGAFDHQYSGKYQYRSWKIDGHEVNDWTGKPNPGEQPTVIKGLLDGIDANDSVKFNYPEPGLFVNSDVTDSKGNSLRKVYRDFKLGFERNGDTYTLKEVRDSSGKDVAGANGYNYESGNNFFPLDEVTYNEYGRKLKSESNLSSKDHNGPHNYYFGMRYDITFKLGDYIGDLNYSFTGDDDMWVVLDKGKYNGLGKVIIDLGGIHDAATANVDLWKELFGSDYANGASDKDKKRASLSKDQKNEEHTLTVLYMERGTGLSNCKMNFTLPYAEISSVTTTDLASFTFDKVKKDNTPLPGATFKLYTDSECTTEVKTKTSGNDGTVTFDKLFPGTYYMKEVQAPDGYIASSEVWTVDVPTGSTTATLKDSKGNTVTSIINETPEEVINSSMVASKTAKVKDWDQRTYDITINATSKSTSTITSTKTPTADIMLVLDVSGSMGYSMGDSYTYVADNNSDVRRNLNKSTTYYILVNGSYKEMQYKRSYRYGNYYWRVEDDDGYYDAANDRYKNCGIYTKAASGTRLDALKTAVNHFIEDTASKSPSSRIGITVFSRSGKSNNGKYVDLGEVGEVNSTKVTELKNFVNGLSADGGTDPALGLATAGCAYTAENAAKLTEVFQSISSTISKNVDITGATITDVIDKRFEILDQDENGNYKVITDKDFKENKYTLKNGGVVTKRDDGTYQVQWTDQTIKHTTDGTNGWSQTITVKAKDSFIGGNNIPTNVSPDSKISVGGMEKILDQPKVNVKVNLLKQDKEITIYKGDTTVPTVDDVRNEIFNTTGTTSYINGTISAADAEDRITYQWYKVDEKGNEVPIEETSIRTAPDDTTEYHLKVTYSPAETSDQTSKDNTDQKCVEDIVLIGTYKINVIKGQIQIKKTVTEATNKDRTFTFNVKDSTGNDISGSPVTVKVEANQTSGDAVIENLPRETYTVTEQNSDNYQLKDYGVVLGETDCQSTSDKDSPITFTLGNDKAGNNVIKDYTYTSTDGGVKGVASYTNEMVTNLDLKKTDAGETPLTGAKFKLEKKDNSGKWTSVETNYDDFTVLNGNTEDDIELKKLTSGDYRLTEITAPTGYMVLSSKIEFKVAQGKVTFTNAEGTASNMWELSTDTTDATKPPVLTIKNQKVYSLPEAGGSGIYWYMIGGMLLMVTSAWILYKNKCKEVLGK